MTFVGPPPAAIELFGDKTSSREFAAKCDVRCAVGSPVLSNVEACRAFVEAQSDKMRFPLLLKAANGGGGKGQRVIRKMEELEAGFKRPFFVN